jgi:hypothetical protein
MFCFVCVCVCVCVCVWVGVEGKGKVGPVTNLCLCFDLGFDVLSFLSLCLVRGFECDARTNNL